VNQFVLARFHCFSFLLQKNLTIPTFSIWARSSRFLFASSAWSRTSCVCAPFLSDCNLERECGYFCCARLRSAVTQSSCFRSSSGWRSNLEKHSGWEFRLFGTGSEIYWVFKGGNTLFKFQHLFSGAFPGNSNIACVLDWHLRLHDRNFFMEKSNRVAEFLACRNAEIFDLTRFRWQSFG
jgi:hypothetical protein